MNTLLLTLSCLGFGALFFSALGLIELWLIYRESRNKHERRGRPRRYCYDQRVIERIRP